MTTFLDALIGACAVTLISGFVAVIRSQMILNKNVNKLVKMDELRAVDFEAVAKVQRPMLVGIKASLEAHRDGKCNGNVNSAHLDITDAMRDYDKYLSSLVRRGR